MITEILIKSKRFVNKMLDKRINYLEALKMQSLINSMTFANKELRKQREFTRKSRLKVYNDRVRSREKRNAFAVEINRIQEEN